jgi:hypothetical protein
MRERESSPKYAQIALIVAGLSLLGIYGYMSLREDLLTPVWLYLFLYGLAFGWYIYSAARIVPGIEAKAKAFIPIIVVFGILFRLVLVPAPPSISTDIYRYVWDGRLINHDINPYRWAPYDPRLAQLRDPVIWDPMEYKAYQTVYMPVSQAFFAAANFLFHNNLAGYKLIFVVMDGGVILLLVSLLRRLNLPVANVIWYAWCPLPITEVGLAGHQDTVGVFMLMAAFVLMTQQRWRKCAVVLVAAGLTKGFALLLLPLFTRRYGWKFAVVAAISLLYLGLPLWVYLPDFLHGMQQYLSTVHVNSGLFNGFNVLLSLVMRHYHYLITTRVSDLAILAAVAWSAFSRPQTDHEMVRRAVIVLATCLLVVPTMFPWYLLWILPLIAAFKPRPSAAFIVLAGSTALLYTYYIARMPYWWTPLAEYVPFYALLWYEWRTGYWRGLEATSPVIAPFAPSRSDGSPREERVPLDAAGAAAD